MFKYIVFLVLLCQVNVVCVHSQTTNLTFPESEVQSIKNAIINTNKFHPIPNSPNEWHLCCTDSVLNTLIKIGNASLNYKFPSISATDFLEFVNSGNRTTYQNLSFEKRNKLFYLAIAESIENNGRFIPTIMDGIWNICEESYWGIPAHLNLQKAGFGLPDVQNPTVDLFAAETSATLAWVDYFVGEALDKKSKLIRERIRLEVDKRIFRPMLASNFSWMGRDDNSVKMNNWAPWIISNYIITSLVLQDKRDEKISSIDLSFKILNRYLQNVGKDGGCDEGPGYWFASVGALYDAMRLVKDASDTESLLFQKPLIKKMVSYIYKAHISDSYFINIGDAPAKINPNGKTLLRMGEDFSDKTLISFGNWANNKFPFSLNNNSPEQFQKSNILYNICYKQKPFIDIDNYKGVSEMYFSDIQLMATRTKNDLFFASHGGNNGESHNHNDVGDFILYADGKPVIIDVGPGTYTAKTFSSSRYDLWFNSSKYHNLPFTDSVGQSAGINFKATNVDYQVYDSLVRFSLNIEDAYNKNAGISCLRRTSLVHANGTIEVTDSFRVDKSIDFFSQSLMTPCETDISKNGKILFRCSNTSIIEMNYNAKNWMVSKEKILLVTPEDERFKNAWDKKPIWRILLTAKNPKYLSKNSMRFKKHENEGDEK